MPNTMKQSKKALEDMYEQFYCISTNNNQFKKQQKHLSGYRFNLIL